MPRATGTGTHVARYEQAWEAINRLIRRGGSWSGHERNCFFVQGPGGRFENVSAVSGLDVPEDGRGLAVWDFDRDGDEDLILKSRNAPQVRIWRNDCQKPGSRIQLELEGTVSNRQAVGARVTLAAGALSRVKEVCAGSGFLSQSSRVLHFGLGDARAVDRIDVRWPSGKVQTFRDIAVNRRYRLREGEEKLVERDFEPPSRPRVDFAEQQEVVPPSIGSQFWLIAPCPLPALELTGASGAPVNLASFRGRPLVVSFWSPDCPRCMGELESWSIERARPRAGSAAEAGWPALLAVTQAPPAASESALEKSRIATVARKLAIDAAIVSEESSLAAGVLLEEVGHWPREIPVPASILVDSDGRIVKLYRGSVAWEKLARDAALIPATEAARLEAALPFPGKYYSTDLQRNDFQLGVSYLEAGLLDPAFLAFERSLARKPDQPDALYNTGVILQRRGDKEKAFERYKEAIEWQPDFVDARANLGVILAESGRLDEAAQELERVLELRGDHAEALINLGNVELSRGRAEKALRSFSAAAELEPEIPQIQKKVGDACRRAGDVESARRAYERAIQLAPRDPEAWSNLGVLKAESGRLEEALKDCEKAIEVDPAYASAQNNAGLILQGLGRHAEAILRFRRAIELKPNLAQPYLNLARALVRDGDEDEARRILKSLLELQPDHAAAMEMLRKLKRK